MSKATDIARDIVSTATEYGWTVDVRRDILTIQKVFTAGSVSEFTMADSEYYLILGKLPTVRAGSIWGTDGGGVGGLSAIEKGVFSMHKSGGSKRVLSAISKLV